MSQERLSMRKIKDILRLKFDSQLSNGLIAKSLGISKSSVSTYLSNAKSAGLTWDLVKDNKLDDREISRLIYSNTGPHKDKATKPLPDCQYIHLELKKKGVTKMLLWQEYREVHPDGYGYTQFCYYYEQWAKKLKLSMRQTHHAGEKMFIDYSGMTFPIYDPKTGEKRAAEIFIAVLGASSYTFAEASESQKLPCWIRSHINAFEYFDGVTEILVPDNLKSGVTKPCRYDPDINPTYQDFSSYYRTVVIPARVRKPKDKAKAEGGVLLAQRWILAALRNRKFFSISELNQAISLLLEKLNNKPMQKIKKSRRELYLEIDRPALKPLPQKRYEYAEFKICRVNIDYHIEVDNHYYSVPYTLAQEKVDVRITHFTIEVFYRGKRVAAHKRSYFKYKSTTLSEHMPKSHQRYAKWTPQRIINWGKSNGESVGILFEAIMKSRPHPEQGFRTCLGIIRLADTYGKERLNKACKKALTLKAYSVSRVKGILQHKLEDYYPSQENLPLTPVKHKHIRGGKYFKGDPI